MKLLFNQKTFVYLVAILTLPLVFTSCGNDDDAPARDQFLGVYDVFETCNSGPLSYTITILESAAGENQILIGNLYDWEEQITATVDGNALTITNVEADGITFNGTGTIDGNTLTILYTAKNAFGDEDTCNAICTKK